MSEQSIEIGRRIRTRREELELTQSDLGNAIGVNKSTIMRYESGQVERIKIPLLQEIARKLDVSPEWLALKTDQVGSYAVADRSPSVSAPAFDIFSIPNIMPVPEMRKIPLLGAIACGEPILAVENINEYVNVPKDVKADFALTCKGDSMINARIFNGDVVYIHLQERVENGEIAAVLIDNEATLKRVRLFEDHISLEPENPMYRPIVYWGEDMNKVRILGKAMFFVSPVL